MRVRYMSGLVVASFLTGLLVTPAKADPDQAFVFFSQWSALIDQDATNAIQHAANLAKGSANHKVVVKGFADTTGSETANKLLSQLRAQVVADQLIVDGVPAASITQDAMGETPAPEGSKQESRRVSITVE